MDKIELEILEDGTVSISTDKISDKNHANADELLEQLEKMLGGKTLIKKKQGEQKELVHIHKRINS
jgi:hypothetical protein